MSTLLELFTEEDFALIFEALESRKKHYEQRIPQQTIDAAYGSVTESNARKVRRQGTSLARIQSIISSEACEDSKQPIITEKHIN